MAVDTTDAQHGRYALRFTVPSTSMLTTPWSQACIDPYYPSVHREAECDAGSPGTYLPAGTHYTFRLWARCEPDGMRIKITTGHWLVDPSANAAFHTFGTYKKNETVKLSAVSSPSGQKLNSTWQIVVGVLPPVAWGR
eukprot:SAG31_NODE_8351_length_1468_cov_1.231556_1_plen_137_part_10